MKQIFWQAWRDLVFVHWEIDPAVLEGLLPPQLEPELCNGKAYIGLVPFRMTDIRHVLLPKVPGCSATLETNLRTYVKRRRVAREPIPAVWFFSLEASSALAVLVARLGFGLPYFKASMSLERRESADDKLWITATSARRWPPPVPAHSLVEAEFASSEALKPAELGTLEYFLFERYALFSQKHGQLKYAQVQHAPYELAPGRLLRFDSNTLLEAAGLPALTGKESIVVHRSADVVVKIGKIERPQE